MACYIRFSSANKNIRSTIPHVVDLGLKDTQGNVVAMKKRLDLAGIFKTWIKSRHLHFAHFDVGGQSKNDFDF